MTIVVFGLATLPATASAAPGPGQTPLPPILTPEEIARIRNRPPRLDTGFCHPSPTDSSFRLGVRALDNPRDTNIRLEIWTSWLDDRVEVPVRPVDGITSYIAGYARLSKPTELGYMIFRMVDGFGASSDWWHVSVTEGGECDRQ